MIGNTVINIISFDNNSERRKNSWRGDFSFLSMVYVASVYSSGLSSRNSRIFSTTPCYIRFWD